LSTLDTAYPVGSTPRPPLCRIAVIRLSLRDFRCHRALHLELAAEPVILVGANGSGKTSVLEALSLLAPGRGLRRAPLGEMLYTNGGTRAAAWSVTARLQAPVAPVDIVSGFAEDGARDRRQLSIDGQVSRSRAALAELLAVIWLTPDMDRLFADGPQARRRFLDRLVWGVDPAHAGRVAAYERALQQRSALLRRSQPEAAWLTALEETMAAHGVAVAAARRQTTAQLTAIAASAPPDFPAVRVAASGAVEDWLDDGPALAVEERLRGAFAESRSADATSGGAAVGPHRSDMQVHHGSSGRRAQECSTGEQKMLLISLVLSGCRLLARERGTPPLLLLDDVAAHLDAARRAAVFEAVADLGAQAWYAGCDPEVFRPLVGRAQVLSLDAVPPAATLHEAEAIG